MTPEVATLLQPGLTIYNEGGRFDLAHLISRVRPSAGRSLPGGASPIPSPRQDFRLSVVVEENGARAGRTAVYALGGTRMGTDFLVGQPSVPPPAPATAQPVCRKVEAVLHAGSGAP